MDLVSGTQCPAWIDQLEKWSEQGSGPKGLKNVVTALMTVFQTKNRIVNFFFSLSSLAVYTRSDTQLPMSRAGGQGQ